MSETIKQTLVELTEKLLNSIAKGDWKEYAKLCDGSLSAFEPEACGHLVKGLGFHKFYFENLSFRAPSNTSLVDVDVRLIGPDDNNPIAAIVSYVRLIQRLENSNTAKTHAFEETRVWENREGQWKHVHFHRSPAPNH